MSNKISNKNENVLNDDYKNKIEIVIEIQIKTLTSLKLIGLNNNM